VAATAGPTAPPAPAANQTPNAIEQPRKATKGTHVPTQDLYGNVSMLNQSTIVTGPSFTSSRRIRAPKTPDATSTPSARSAVQNAS
jgi:hypothetical protein